MPKYYGIQRSGEYLAHYGVKGMRWGVRKAKESGNSRQLDRQWRKANRKLHRLNKKANMEVQFKRQRRLKSATAQSIIGGGAGGFSGVAAATTQMKNQFKRAGLATAGLAGGAALAGAIPSIMLHKTHKRLMPEGHQKAVTKAQDWAKEMNRAFHKTKYQGKTKPFNDTYVTRTAKYLPQEAKRGNAMPYEIEIRSVSGRELSNTYANAMERRKRRRK